MNTEDFQIPKGISADELELLQAVAQLLTNAEFDTLMKQGDEQEGVIVDACGQTWTVTQQRQASMKRPRRRPSRRRPNLDSIRRKAVIR